MASLASVVINMSVNSARLAAGLRQSERMTRTFVQRTQGGFSRLRGSIGGLRTALIGVTAVLGTRELLNNADAQIKAADAAGISFDAYQDLSQGLELAGVNQAGFMRGLRTLANAFQQAEMGSAQFVEGFAQIGLSYEQLAALSPENRFLAVVNGLNMVDDATTRTALANDLLGRSFADVNVNAQNLIRDGAGIANVNEEAARSAENVNDRFAELSGTLRNLLTNAIVPLLENIVPLIQQFVAFLAENPRIVAFAAALAAISAVVIPLGIALSSVVSVLGIFGAVIGSPLIAAIAAITAAVGAVVLIFRNWGNILNRIRGIFGGTVDEIATEAAVLPEIATMVGEDFTTNLTTALQTTSDTAVTSIIPEMVAGIRRHVEQLPDIGEQAGSGFSRGFLGALREAQDATMEFQRIGSDAFNGLSDQITDFVTTGQTSFREFAASIIRDIISIQVRRGLGNLFLGGLGGGGGLGDLFGGFRQNGGPVQQGRAYVVGEGGPEVFVPRADGQIVANGQGSGGQNITYNINAIDTASFQSTLARDPSFVSGLVQRGNRQLGIA